MRRALVERIVAGKRDLHPELRRPLTWARLRTVCTRERVALALADLPPEHPAQLVPFFDRWSILVSDDLAPRERVRLAAHELAHVWVHHDALHDRWEVVYQASNADPAGQFEREAEAVAWLLLEGASELPAEPRPTRRALTRAVPPAFDPYASSVATAFGRLTPRYGGRDGETPLQRAMRLARPLRREMRSGPENDRGIITHSPGRVRYVDREGREWTVWDVALRGGARVAVPGGAIGARLRYFVNASGGRRVYVFESKRELRDVAERHFERQLRESTVARVHHLALREA